MSGQTKMLMREKITERARHHKLDSKDKAVQHMNQLENRELNRFVQEMCRTQRKYAHHMDQNLKHFKKMRRKSMGKVLLLNNGDAKYARSYHSGKSGSRKDKWDVNGDINSQELVTIAETHERRRASIFPGSENGLTMRSDIKLSTSLPYQKADILKFPAEGQQSARETKPLPSLDSVDEECDASRVPLNGLTPLPDIKVTERTASKSPIITQPTAVCKDKPVLPDISPRVDSLRATSPRMEQQSSKAASPNPLLSLPLDGSAHGSDASSYKLQLSPALSNYTRRGSTDGAAIPYLLAYNEREIEELEKEKKKNRLQQRLRRQSMRTDQVHSNVSSWIKEFDQQLKEQRRLQNLYKDPEHADEDEYSSDED